jgi:hypothetical protein
MLAAMVLAVFTVFSAGSMTHGFVAYYAASRLLVSGELGPIAYDDRWFGERFSSSPQQRARDLHAQSADDGVDGAAAGRLDAQPARAIGSSCRCARSSRCRGARRISGASQSRCCRFP